MTKPVILPVEPNPVGPKRSEPPNSDNIWRPLGLGFRPFFLLAAIAAALLMVAWLLSWHRAPASAMSYYGHVTWHSHEMLFGYIAAVAAGFLLTAVRNWTGVQTPTGTPLLLLALLWLAGRLLPWIPGAPGPLTAFVDITFLPALGAVLAAALWQGKNRANRWFLVILLGMTAANALVHAHALGLTDQTATMGIRIMLDLVLLLLALVGGRVLPFFIEKAVPNAHPISRRWVEVCGFVLFGALIAAEAASPSGPAMALVLFALALVQGVRLMGWYDHGVWRIPLLWVLFTGYAWIVVGLGLLGLSHLYPSLVSASPALHALTVGGIGVFTVGMMARVALGHTGRPLIPAKAINVAFVVINLAAVIRTFGPVLMPSWYVSWVMLAGLLWTVTFVIFTLIYAPILLKARADGRPD